VAYPRDYPDMMEDMRKTMKASGYSMSAQKNTDHFSNSILEL
jgi:hypothetical protein